MQCCFAFNYAISFCYKEECVMFQVKSDRKETENKTIRFPVPLIRRIEEAIIGKDTSFSGFVIQACEYALSNMEDNKVE